MAKSPWTEEVACGNRAAIDRWIGDLKVTQRRKLAKHMDIAAGAGVQVLTDHIFDNLAKARRTKAVREIYKLTH